MQSTVKEEGCHLKIAQSRDERHNKIDYERVTSQMLQFLTVRRLAPVRRVSSLYLTMDPWAGRMNSDLRPEW